MNYPKFVEGFNAVQSAVHQTAIEKGWWTQRHALLGDYDFTSEYDQKMQNFAKQILDSNIIALIHSELSEAIEAMRHNNPPSEHIPEFSGVEEELADAVIRIMDFAQAKGYRLAEAILAKMEFNAGRLYKHGGKEF